MNNMNNKIVFGVGGIIIGLLLANIFMPTVFSGYRNGGFGMMGWRNNVNYQTASTIDRHFIEQMIPHHEGAVEMAQLALEKSKRAEIKVLAAAIIKDQTKEIQERSRF